MAVLAILEFFVYQHTWMKYEYEVDKDFSSWMCISSACSIWQPICQIRQLMHFPQIQDSHNLERVINHATGSHGVSGIFMKYDINSLMVTVTEQHMPFWQFLVRLCGIIGGIFSTTGMVHGLVGFLVDIVCCRFKLGTYKPKDVSIIVFFVNFILFVFTTNTTSYCCVLC
ncbi:Endoplasmic reticulum-Golgi intermediate compartment protein 2 [Acipenser ruthenus]|uniref:Endoplasmic reticulum-Golgi intermediate compartment protein n=1 Tax=Acipenser ruthenus TaxID=7906 RepID=A0A444UM23_ACIRT|nr:Endoplasmic reticulum-Golgi intermediate compartment protein 2 [Acipenser ruthenus]